MSKTTKVVGLVVIATVSSLPVVGLNYIGWAVALWWGRR